MHEDDEDKRMRLHTWKVLNALRDLQAELELIARDPEADRAIRRRLGL